MRAVGLKAMLVGLCGLGLAACASAPAITGLPVDTGPEAADAPPQAPGEALAYIDAFSEESITVAILLPLSGQRAAIGESLFNAATMALFDAYDPRLRLLPFDTQATPAGARRAVEAALDAGADVILGPLFFDSVHAAGPIASAAGVPMIAFTNDRSAAGGGVYLLSFLPDEEVSRIVAHAANQGRRSIAALIPEGAYGELVLEAFGRAANRYGIAISRIEIYPREAEALFSPVRDLADYDSRHQAYLREREVLQEMDDDLAQELLKELQSVETIGEVPFDAVLLPEGGGLVRSLAALLPFYEVDPEKVMFLGTGLWQDPSLLREPPLNGARFAAPNYQRWAEFVGRYRGLYGEAPPRIATLAYDAMALVASLAREPFPEARFGRDAFLDPNGFSGVDGLFRFTETGTAERRLSVIEIGPRGFAEVEPAPASFVTTVGRAATPEAAPEPR